ncbi:MAG: hypothetical protein WDN67_02640 [Candidatus Moraniibacteriota bacterium]
MPLPDLRTLLIDTSDVTNNDISRLIAAIVFMAIFAGTLLVLALQFVIRLIALLILVILSPIGFVGGAVPGMQSIASQWWKYFMKYAFFGPAAMFMLVLSAQFFYAIGGNNGGTYQNFVQSAGSSTSQTWTDMVASMAIFSIPIILLWFTIGLGQKMAVVSAGAGFASGAFVQKKLKGLGAGTLKGIASPVTTRAKGLGQGIKEGAYKGKLLGVDYGSKGIGKFLAGKTYKQGGENAEAKYRGFAQGRGAGAQTELEKLHNKRVTEEEKSLEEQRTNRSTLLQMAKNDNKKYKKEQVEAAVNVLSKKDGITNEAEMNIALQALESANGKGSQATLDKKQAIIKKAGGEIYQSADGLANAASILGDDVKSIGALVDKANDKALGGLSDDSQPRGKRAENYRKIFTITDSTGKTVKSDALKSKLDTKLKKEGKIKVLIDAELDEQNALISTGIVSEPELYRERFLKMSPKDIAKADGLNGDLSTPMNPHLKDFIKSQLDTGSWTLKDQQDAFAELKSAQKEVWRKEGFQPGK